jgi:predicted dinucleotide-binding enzyme
MKIGFIGSGIVAQTLGSGFLKHGHDVILGSRTPAKLADWKSQNPSATIGTFADAASSADLIVLAVKGPAASSALRLAGVTNLAGKTIIDASNPVQEVPPEEGVLTLYTKPTESLLQQLQGEFPAANFVKAFNTVGVATMVNPDFNGIKPTMFICGDNAAAKQSVTTILDTFGWEAADMGGAIAARAIEPLCVLWCIPGFLHNQWTHAFKLLTRN